MLFTPQIEYRLDSEEVPGIYSPGSSTQTRRRATDFVSPPRWLTPRPGEGPTGDQAAKVSNCMLFASMYCMSSSCRQAWLAAAVRRPRNEDHRIGSKRCCLPGPKLALKEQTTDTSHQSGNELVGHQDQDHEPNQLNLIW